MHILKSHEDLERFENNSASLFVNLVSTAGCDTLVLSFPLSTREQDGWGLQGPFWKGFPLSATFFPRDSSACSQPQIR